MKRILLAGATSIALGAAMLGHGLAGAQDAPESLLPPGFDDPAPAPAPSPAPAPRQTQAPRPAPTPSAAPQPRGTPVVQPLPDSSGPSAGSAAPPRPSQPGPVPDDLPTIAELERLDTDELDALLGLRPRTDIPPAARRSLERVGILAPDEGGLPTNSLANQPASLVRAALEGIRGPLVSRWGHIMLRRALASRLAAPEGMNPVTFAALRSRLLNRMGEHRAARAIVQDIDTEDWNNALAGSAIDAYFGTADIIGICPLARYRGDIREGEQWRLLQAICASYAGETSRARANIGRMRSRGEVPLIDALLAQRFAGAAGEGRSAVNLEWDEVDNLTPWRFALANALGAEIPDNLLSDADPYYQRIAATMPMLPYTRRMPAAQVAAREGILSSQALIDLYSQYYAEAGREGDIGADAYQLRIAYVNANPVERMAAIRSLWGTGGIDYASQVLTAYAAARLPADSQFANDAAPLIASMLTAGLDRDAMEWSDVVDEGTLGWAMLALADPVDDASFDSGDVDSFASDDSSDNARKTGFLVAGLAGLGRLEQGDIADLNDDYGLGLDRRTAWSTAIMQAGEARNAALVAMLAGVGMQGDDWSMMTPLHLYHIVRALDRSGLSAEARMIAAEAVARG